MKNVKTIFRKEWDRVIKDKRLIFSVMILPGLLLFLIYSFIGTAVDSSVKKTPSNVAIVNPISEFTSIYSPAEADYNLTVVSITQAEIPSYEAQVDAETWDLIIIFPDNLTSFDGTTDIPVVSVYCNRNNINSSGVTNRFLVYLNTMQTTLAYDLYGDKSYFHMSIGGTTVDPNMETGSMISMIMPMLVVMFLFSGAMSIGPESIAGEKERNTISTLLITPVKRSEIALGKVMSLSVLSLLSALSSFLGIILSLPKLLGIEASNAYSIYSVGDYLMILGLLFSTVFVIIGAIAVISTFAKSVKEATTLVLPLYIITVLVGITSLFDSGANSMYIMYLIPIYNTVQTLTAILRFDPSSWIYLVITVIANIGYLVLFVYVLQKMFQNEKIMFSK